MRQGHMNEGCENRGGLISGREGLAMCGQVFEMQLDGRAGMGGSLLDGCPVGHASGQGGDQHGITAFGLRNQIYLV